MTVHEPDPSGKLSPQARQLLAGPEGAEGAVSVDLLIRVSAAVPSARDRLEAAGVTVRTVAGDVVTASAPVSALRPLAELDDVVAIEVATPLFGESPPTD